MNPILFDLRRKQQHSRSIAPVKVPLPLNGTSHTAGWALNGTAPSRPFPPVLLTPDGFVFDSVWDMPGLGPQLQYTKRRGRGPALGATFYVPAGATSEAITRRAREVAASFQEASPA